MALPVLTACRYAIPLREGGSLPAVVEVEEGGLYAVKFRGAGQGARALLAELIGGMIAQCLGLQVPELALVHLEEGFGRAEPDPEIQDILRGSRGLNAGLLYLEGAFTYDPLAYGDRVSPREAADIIWLDALLTNIDRTARNPNILVWEDRLWLIDHGAAMYFHHDWASVDETRARSAFLPIREHVLLPAAGDLLDTDARLAPLLSVDVLQAILKAVPDELLMDAPQGREPDFATAEQNREAYLNYFQARLLEPRTFAIEAASAKTASERLAPVMLPYRR